MKRLLRSVIDIGDGSITQDQLSDNFQKLYATEIEWTRPEDQRIFDYLLGFFQQRTELPSLQTVRDYFEGIGTVGDIEAVERLKDIESASWYTRSNFQHLLRTLKEEQNRTKAVALLKEAHEIITKGVEVKEGTEKVRKQGLRDALIHFSAQAVELIQSESFSRTEGDIFSARDAKEAIEEYRAAAADQTKAWGKITGIEEIDDACHGLKPGELHVHAAFPSELKTMLAANWAYNLAVRYQTNVVYFTLEMPYDQMRRNFYTIHSTNGIWSGVHAPLDYRKIRDGELSPDELQFYEAVCRDLDSPKYGQLKVIAPDRDMTIPDIRLKCEMINKETDAGVGFVVIDHGQLVTPVRHSKDYVIELNTIIRDAKKMALHFGNGRKIPVLMLFQINRHGKDDAAKNGGVYKASAIAYANECLAEGTLVRTSEGMVPIEKVAVGSKVWSHTGWKDVLRRFEHGIRPTVRVATDHGRFVQCTKDHLFRTLRTDGELEWVPAERLRGRWVLADIGFVGEETYWPLHRLYLRLYKHYARMTTPDERLSRHAARLRTTSGLVPRSVLEVLLRKVPLEDPLVCTVSTLLQTCHAQRVTSVRKDIPQEVFDLEVSGDHEYSTGGLLTHNCEKSADVITTTYLDDTHRSAGTTLICNLKNRDNQQFAPFTASVEFGCRRIKSMTPFDQSPGAGMGLEDLI